MPIVHRLDQSRKSGLSGRTERSARLRSSSMPEYCIVRLTTEQVQLCLQIDPVTIEGRVLAAQIVNEPRKGICPHFLNRGLCSGILGRPVTCIETLEPNTQRFAFVRRFPIRWLNG